MNKLILAAITVVTSLTVGAAAMHVTKADAASSNCTVEVIGDRNTANDSNSKFTKDGLKVTAKVKVTGNNCNEPVALAAFKSTESNRPLSAQRLHDVTLKNFSSGTHDVSVEVPACYFQVDLVKGHDVATKNGSALHYGPDRLMGWLVGGNRDCQMPTATCDSLSVAKLSRTQFRFDGKATLKNGATLRAYEFTISRNGQVVDTKTVRTHDTNASLNYKQTQPGTYKVSMTVLTSEGDQTDKACNGTFTVKTVTTGNIEVCDLTTHQVVEIPQTQPLGTRYTTDLTKCDVPTTPGTETPKALVDTGPGAVAAVAGGVSTLSGIGHLILTRRRLF